MSKDIEAYKRFASKCPHRISIQEERRPANALCIEAFGGGDRCKLCVPDHWPKNISAARWIMSGGSPLVFGYCSKACALGQEWCPECGHRKENHFNGVCRVTEDGSPFPCGCEHYKKA